MARLVWLVLDEQSVLTCAQGFQGVCLDMADAPSRNANTTTS